MTSLIVRPVKRETKLATGSMGTIMAPPSKSQTLRAILFASLANGTSIISRPLYSPDSLAMMSACRMLGARVIQHPHQLVIAGTGGKPSQPEQIIDAGNSGLVLRFIAAIAAILHGTTIISGDESIRSRRVIQPLINAVNQLGGTAYTAHDDYAPVLIKGSIQSGSATLDGHDSQPVSALLIACSFLNGITELTVNHPGETPWINVTLDWLKRLNITVEQDNYSFYRVHGGSMIEAFNYKVPSDFSSITYPIAAALITGSTIIITDVDFSDSQGDKHFLTLLNNSGVVMDINNDQGQIIIKPSPSLSFGQVDMSHFIDAITLLAVLACHAKTKTTLTHAAIARMKESNRIAVIKNALNKMGGKIEETEDGLIIFPSTLSTFELDSHSDHRIALALVIAALMTEGESKIHGIDCIDKSYPSFLSDMGSLGIPYDISRSSP